MPQLTIRVQECGCIALPDGIMSTLQLHAGSLLDLSLNAEGTSVRLTPLAEPPDERPIVQHAACPLPFQQ